jgi:hypothetical protein
MFWLGFIAGIAATFIALFVWLTRSGDLVDDMPDEHSQWPGADAGVSHHYGSE